MKKSFSTEGDIIKLVSKIVNQFGDEYDTSTMEIKIGINKHKREKLDAYLFRKFNKVSTIPEVGDETVLNIAGIKIILHDSDDKTPTIEKDEFGNEFISV